MNRTRRLSAALVAVAFIVPCVVATGASAKKATLKVATSQKKALQRDGLQVKVKGLKTKGKKKAKVKIKARSSTFDQQDLRNLTKAAKVRTKKKSAVALLQLTNNGRKSITSCESRKIVISGKGVKQGQGPAEAQHQGVQAEADRPEPRRRLQLHRRPGGLALHAALPRRLLHGQGQLQLDRPPDRASPTRGMPQNEDGKPIAAAPYNLNDGFSPGQVITLKVPGLDNPEALTKTNPIPLADLSRNESQDSKEPIVVIDAETGKRTPIWVEIDSNASTAREHRAADPRRDPVRVRAPLHRRHAQAQGRERQQAARPPRASATTATTCRRTRRRSTISASGSTRSSAPCARSRSSARTCISPGTSRSPRTRTSPSGCSTSATTPSPSSATPTSRDGVVEGTAPAFAIDTVANNPNPEIARRVTGTFTVPCYLTNSCEAPAVFTLDSTGNPIRHGTYQANFDCIIPDAAVAATPGRPSLYGHGLLGSAGEVGSAPQRSLANTHNFVFCATDEIGFASEDIGNTIGILRDLGRFPELTDRTQQGLLNELYLGPPDGSTRTGSSATRLPAGPARARR